jgi:Tol biopolymer transport system component
LFQDWSTGRAIAYVVPSEGGVLKRILPDDRGNEIDPGWSPDGRKIVFCEGFKRDPKSQLSILDIARQVVAYVPGSATAWSPRWSPDGRFIAAISFDETTLKFFDIESQQWPAHSMNSVIDNPTFCRDGRYLYFELRDKANPEALRVMRFAVKGSDAELVANLKGRPSASGWMSLDSSDAPLKMREVGTSEYLRPHPRGKMNENGVGHSASVS